MARQLVGLCFLSSILAVGGAGAVERPLPVSPGGPAGGLIEARCPTFSWALADGATSYELVIYTNEEDVEDPQIVLQRSLPGSASSWTPDLDRCLERGIEYAWSVRARGAGGTSGWSAASIFQVAAGPSEEEFERALAVMRRYLSKSKNQAIPEGTFPQVPRNMVLDSSQGTLRTSGPAVSSLSGEAGMIINDQRVLRGREKKTGVLFNTRDLESGQSATFAVTCPEGKIIVSGGVRTGGSEVRITESFPSEDNEWQTTIYNSGTQNVSVEDLVIDVICVQQ